MGLFEKIFGTHSDNELKRIYPIVDHIEALEPEMQKLTDEELRAKTKEYKERYANGETLDDLLWTKTTNLEAFIACAISALKGCPERSSAVHIQQEMP